MTLEELLENPSSIGSIAFNSIGKKFDYLGSICEAILINDNGEVVLQDDYSIDCFYMVGIKRFVEKLKTGEIAEYMPEVST
jgi:hypothetical protein